MEDLTRLRMEIKTDLELIELRQQDMARQVEQMADRAKESANAAQQSAEAAQKAAEAAQRAAEAAQRGAEAAQKGAEAAQQAGEATAQLGREVAAHMHWVGGRTRLMNQRFEVFLDAVESELKVDRGDIEDLKRRVSNLERERPPA